MRLLTLEDFNTKGKTVFLRVDMNSPIDPKTMEILETSRIREATESLKDLGGGKGCDSLTPRKGWKQGLHWHG